MSEITLKEIPVQILYVPLNGTVVLRLPAEDFTDEIATTWMAIVTKALRRPDVTVIAIPNNIDLAVVQRR